MERVTYMRYLRLKYGITTRELANAAGVSHQHISRVELEPVGERGIILMQRAFERVIENRKKQTDLLAADYAANRNRLLEMEDGI